MSEEAEILRKCISCHDKTHMPKNQKNRGEVMYLSCVSLTKSVLVEAQKGLC